MFTLFAEKADVSVGVLLVAFGNVRSSPACGVPCGLQFVAVVNFLGSGATVDLEDWQVEQIPEPGD